MKETWKYVLGYKDKYQVSSLGNIRNNDCLLNKYFNSNGDLFVKLYRNNISTEILVSRLVGVHFVENLYNRILLRHIDGNKENNNYTNLEWITYIV